MIFSIYDLLGDSCVFPPTMPLDIENHVELVLKVGIWFFRNKFNSLISYKFLVEYNLHCIIKKRMKLCSENYLDQEQFKLICLKVNSK